MSTDLLAMWFLGGFLFLLPVCLGIWGFAAWISKQIEARQKRPRLEAEAATKLADAERKLEEARIRRLELELGLTTSPALEHSPAGLLASKITPKEKP